MHYSDIIIRILLAIAIGGVIGYEREMRNRPAGFVTHTLVCVGACVVSLIQVHMVEDVLNQIKMNPSLINVLKADSGRIVAQVVTGVGFLGAGTIIFDKGSVKGLTTATTIWVVACIGLSVGLGYYTIAGIASVSVFFVMVILKRIGVKVLDRKFILHIEILFDGDDREFIKKTTRFFHRKKVQVRDIEFSETNHGEPKRCFFKLYMGFARDYDKIVEKLNELDGVLGVVRKDK